MLGVLITCAKWVVFGPPIIPEVLSPAAYGDVEIHRGPNDNRPMYVSTPIGRCDSSLPHNLERFAAPYGACRSPQTRSEVEEGIFPGGEEHSYRLLYQQRMKRMLQSYPLSIADPACKKWSVLRSYAAGVPVSESLEHLIRHTIEDYIHEMWVVDEIVRQLHIRQRAGEEEWFHQLKLIGVNRQNAKRCEFWDESRGCEFFFNPKTKVEKYNAAVVRRIEACLKKSLKTFAKSDFDKPLRYLAMCVFQYAAASKRLGTGAGKNTSTRKILNRIEECEARLYEDAEWIYQLMNGGHKNNTNDDGTKKDNVVDDVKKKDDGTPGTFQKLSSRIDVAGQEKGGSVQSAAKVVKGLCRGSYRDTTCPEIVVTFPPEKN